MAPRTPRKASAKKAKTPKQPKQPSKLEERFNRLWGELYPDIPLEREYRPIPGRRFRFDFCHRESLVAVEIHGGRFIKGRHNTASGLKNDSIKTCLANSDGWMVYPLVDDQITPDYLELIASSIRDRLAPPPEQRPEQDRPLRVTPQDHGRKSDPRRPARIGLRG